MSHSTGRPVGDVPLPPDDRGGGPKDFDLSKTFYQIMVSVKRLQRYFCLLCSFGQVVDCFPFVQGGYVFYIDASMLGAFCQIHKDMSYTRIPRAVSQGSFMN